MATFNHMISALVLLLLFSAAKPSSAQIINGLTVGGRICCTVTGNCPVNGTGVMSAPIHLDCNYDGSYVPVGLSVSKKSGSFNITVPTTKAYSFEHPDIPCMVRVQLPLSPASNCSALSLTTGANLYSGLKSTGVGNTAVLGPVRNATITGFVRISGSN